MAAIEERYAFKCEYFDSAADLIRTYLLTFFTRDNSIEMYDPKNKRAFLKRSAYTDLSLSDFIVGGHITVHARQLKIVDYADQFSRRMMETKKSRTLGLIKPDGYSNIGNILNIIQQAGLIVGRLTMVKLPQDKAMSLCRMNPATGQNAVEHASHFSSDVVVAMELVGQDSVNLWQSIIGPDDPQEAKSVAPNSLRAMIGTDSVRNAVHGSVDNPAAASELEFFFGEKAAWTSTALFNNCTLCIIRPHAVKNAGDIIQRILQEGFEISAMRLWHMDKVVAEEFLDVYKGVLPEYPEMVHQMCVGNSLVMEVRQEDAVNSFRQLTGPHDPEVAKHLRVDTLRSQFGIDRVRNAIHCTDLPEDGLLEVEYFFNILYNRKAG